MYGSNIRFIVAKDATNKDLVENGFQEYEDRFQLEHELYEYPYLPEDMHKIKLILRIKKENRRLYINVIDTTDGEEYWDFWYAMIGDVRFAGHNTAHICVKNFYEFMEDLAIAGVIKQLDNEEKHVKIRYTSNDIEKLDYIDGKSDWIDLRSAEDVVMKKGEYRLISLGVAMQLPEGYEALVVPRSSTFKNFGIIQTNHMGVIDNSYCGNDDVWRFPAYALRNTEIHVNDRICQFRIIKNQPPIIFEEVKRLHNNNRGGIGSTGKN